MAGSIEGGARSRGRRKSTEADLNLVPYIDLLTCMIAFLLIAAVWTQLARLQMSQKGQGDSQKGLIDPPLRVAVLVHPEGLTLIEGNEQRPVPSVSGGWNFPALTDGLKQVKLRHPDVLSAEVLSEDRIKFETLVQAMDAVMAAGFPDIALLAAAAP